MNYVLLHNIVDQLSAFEHEIGSSMNEVSIEDFAHWILGRDNLNSQDDVTLNHSETLDSVIVKNLVYMVRFVLRYTDQILDKSPLSTLDEFVLLTHLQFLGPTTASKFAKKQFMKKTTVTTIIKRMIVKGLIVEKEDLDDKRSKLVTMTEYGVGVLFQSMADLNIISKIATGVLSHQEKLNLAGTLHKLFEFHHEFHHLNVEPNLKEIEQKILTKK